MINGGRCYKMINNIGLPGLLLLLAASFGFLGAISSESQAEPLIDINDLTDRFSTRVVEFAVSAARSQVEIQYQAIVPNSKLGQLSIDGLVFTPGPELDMSGCSVSVGRILFQAGSPQKLGAENITTSVYDLNVTISHHLHWKFSSLVNLMDFLNSTYF